MLARSAAAAAGRRCRRALAAWAAPMPEDQFAFMRDVVAAPSPVGLEAAMAEGVLAPRFEAVKLPSWRTRRFVGSASMVLEAPAASEAEGGGGSDPLRVMVVGHSDKIRCQVRHVDSSGKILIESDSHLPLTLLGHDAVLFSEDPAAPGQYRQIRGGTIEALGAIHFAAPELRSGKGGVKPKQLYLDLQLHGEKRQAQVERLGIRPGDALLVERPIRRGFAPDTFVGAYLDNGLGCFVMAEVARLVAEAGGLQRTSCQFTAASHEEIGRFGSRVLASELRPDVIIAVDVNHDYDAAPVKDTDHPPLAMGKGFTMSVGSVVSERLNQFIAEASQAAGVPFQRDCVGRDTGTDAMAGVLGGVDCAVASIGFPIRNMHTISETAHTGDVLAAVHGIVAALQALDACEDAREELRHGHPQLQNAPVYAPGREVFFP